MKTSLYIPAFNAAGTLGSALEAIAAQTRRPDEILVIDDGSTDTTADIAAEWASKGVTVVGQPRNLGLGAARNRALRESSGDVLIGVDSDVAIEPTYVARVMGCFTEHPEIGALCGRLLERHTTTAADRWRCVHMSQDPGKTSKDNPRFLYGCTTSIRRATAVAMGGWNERYTQAYEDVELTERLRRAGIPFRFEARCVAHHLRRDTPESVLTGFWKWFFPAGDRAGHFDSVDQWMAQRLEPVQWSIFRHRFAEDLARARDELLPLTLLMPWWMTVYDLPVLTTRHGARRSEIGFMAASLPGLLHEILGAARAPLEVARWMGGEVEGLLRQIRLQAGRETEVARAAMENMRESAMRAMPSDGAVWKRAATGLEAVAGGGRSNANGVTGSMDRAIVGAESRGLG